MSSTGDSPQSAVGAPTPALSRAYPLPTRDTFGIDIPSPQLTMGNGVGALKSPTIIKTQHNPGFTREGILGAAQKARNMSQSSSETRPSEANGLQKVSSDEGMNPLKRRNTDAGVDYPRRRATIAVSSDEASPPRPRC